MGADVGCQVPAVSLTVIGAMSVLAVTVIVLHLKEKAADEAERKRHLNYGAL